VDIFNLDKLSIFILFFIPGFISIKVWSFLVPSQNRKMSEQLFEAVTYSCINFALLSWLIVLISKDEFQQNSPVLFYIMTFLILFIFPIVWPFLVKLLLTKWSTLHPTPKAWDYFFGLREPCYALIHLKNGKLIGAFYGGRSFASSYPESEDLYFQEVWKVNEEGEFISQINSTKGLLISKDSYDYIEFFEGMKEEEDSQNEQRQEAVE
jgi:hypothetical protein